MPEQTVEVTEERFFAEMGKLYLEAKMLREENARLTRLLTERLAAEGLVA